MECIFKTVHIVPARKIQLLEFGGFLGCLLNILLIRTGGVLNHALKFVRSVGQDAPKYMCHFKVRNNPECPFTLQMFSSLTMNDQPS